DEDIAQVKQNAVDRLINTHLLKEAAIKAGITAESVDVDGELTAVKDSFSDEATFNQALADAEFTLESYKSVLTDILMIEALFEQELELSKIEVGEEEIQAMVDLYLENYGGEDEIDEEDLRDYLAYTLKEEKAEARRSEYIEKLRKESKIEYLVDF
ncbi:MAG: SurA N-terminal domain-containing protein, partial [Eubacteriales bacterium]|nr:SurA N-terminal domain-containing protein [Eubacteriales bacterium]